MKYFSLIWGNIKRRKLRAVLTLLSIFVAFILFGALFIVKYAMSRPITLEGQERLVVRNRVSLTMLLPASYEERIERIDGVDRCDHWNWFGGIYIDRKNFFGNFAVVPDDFYALHQEFLVSPDAKKAWAETRNGAIVGPGLVERFGWKVGQQIQLTSGIWPQTDGKPWEFTVVGVYETKDPAADPTRLFFRWDYFDEGRARGEGLAGWYYVRVKNPQEADRVASAIDAQFANSPYETRAEPEGAFSQGIAKQFGNITLIFTSILTAVFFTILLVVGNTMAQSVRERTEEIGVLKSLGFTDGGVLSLILAESILLAVIGGLAGLAVAKVFSYFLAPIPPMLPVWYFPETYMVMGVGIAILLGVAAGLPPAILAMRLRTSVALRRQG